MSVDLRAISSIGPGGKPRAPKNPSKSQVFRTLFKVLKETELCSLSTVTPRNLAHSAHVYFAYDENLELYFLSHPNSIHCANLRTNDSMAVSLYDSTQKWGNDVGDRGIALYGKCREASGRGAQIAERIYGKRFKKYAAWRASPDYDKEASTWKFYKFVPSRIKVFDEPKFGSGVFITALVGKKSSNKNSK